ncbi:hypothetical protein QBC34DRAFT_405187 [Podospora aff. communis PSN243]|uniref:Uncharacterized protein n=1 Tax=Podospora aff. communis PSN243 TaxID=3040156 RepID=A0AAV9GPQ6_9PEZI|nr:hypothetical protein QBC34DRAFT_405187 [Podospora aff. communis PSN243]
MPPIRKEKNQKVAGGVLAGGVEKKRKGPKPKPLSERVQSWTFDKPKTRQERSYTRERKIEVLMYLVKHRIPFEKSYRKVARRRIGQYNEDADVPEVGPDGRRVWFRSPTYKEASEFWKIPVATISNWWDHREKILDGTGIELPKKPEAPPGGGGPPKPPKPAKPPVDPEEAARLKEQQKEWLAVRGYRAIMKANPQPVPKRARTTPVPILPAGHEALPQPPLQPRQQNQQQPQQGPHPQAPPRTGVPPPAQAPAPAQAQAQLPTKPPFPHHVVYVGQLPESGVFLQHPAAVAGYVPPSAGGPNPWVVLYYGAAPGTPGGFPSPEVPPSLNGQVKIWQPPNGQPPNSHPLNGRPPIAVPAVSTGYAPPPVQQGPVHRSPHPVAPPQPHPPQQASQQQRPVQPPAPQQVQRQGPPQQQQQQQQQPQQQQHQQQRPEQQQPPTPTSQPHPAKSGPQPAANAPSAQQSTSPEPFPGAAAFSAAPPAPVTLTPAHKRGPVPGSKRGPPRRSMLSMPGVGPFKASSLWPTPNGTTGTAATTTNSPPLSAQPDAADSAHPSLLTAAPAQDVHPQPGQHQVTLDTPSEHSPAVPSSEDSAERHGHENHNDNSSNSGDESTPYATPNSGAADDEDMADAEAPESEED